MNDPIICLKCVAILHILLVDLSMSVFVYILSFGPTLIYICVLNRCIFNLMCVMLFAHLLSLWYICIYVQKTGRNKRDIVHFKLFYYCIWIPSFKLLFYIIVIHVPAWFFFWILLLVDSINPKNIFKKSYESLTADLFLKCWKEFSFIRCIIPSIYIYNLDYHLHGFHKLSLWFYFACMRLFCK